MNLQDKTLLIGEEWADEKAVVLLPKLKKELQELMQGRNKNKKKPPFIKIKNDGCWEWLRSKESGGYGNFGINGGTVLCHRYFYEKLIGQIPTGLTLDHLCRNRICCNPLHLEPVSRGVNSLRGFGPLAINSRKTECKNGHSFDSKNTYFYKNRRICKKCSYLRIKKRRLEYGR
jgi:hypothetical protein